MNRDYWESVAANYEEEVLSVYDCDKSGLVSERILVAGKAFPEGRAADLGCGIGKFTSLLSKSFARVEACDISENGLALARIQCKNTGVSFYRLDLTCDVMPFEPVDFALCVNVLIMPLLDERMRAWRTVTNQVASGGTLLIVAPSLESVQMEIYRGVELSLSDGDNCEDALAHSLPCSTTVSELRQGVHRLSGMPTKHYLREELGELLAGHEFDVLDIVKLEYPSDEDSAVRYPWDWLVVAQRR